MATLTLRILFLIFALLSTAASVPFSPADAQVIRESFSTPQSISICNVRDFGAIGNGLVDDTVAIRSALAACQSPGEHGPIQAIVFDESRVFLSGALNISSHQVLYFQPGAVLRAIQSNNTFHWPLIDADPSYPISLRKNSARRYQAFLASFGATQVGLVGNGTIDGRGAYWWALHRAGELSATRPRLVEFSNSRNIVVAGVTLRNSPFWTLRFYSSEQIHVSHISIWNPQGSPNTDGIDVDSSARVIVEYVDINVADDHISIKSGENTAGYEYGRPSEDIIVRHSFFGQGAGLALGSETAGGIRNVSFVNNTMDGSHYGPRMKTCPHYGRPVTQIEWDGLNLLNIKDAAIFVDTQYHRCNNLNENIPHGGYHDIHFRNIWASELPAAGTIDCFLGGCTGFRFEDVRLHSLSGFLASNVSGAAHRTTPYPF